MKRATAIFVPVLVMFLLLAPLALAENDHGEGLYGETSDKVVTNTGFILIIFFPVLVAILSVIQGRLEKRKEERKKAAKGAAVRAQWRGGW
jgi:hypothetical protein